MDRLFLSLALTCSLVAAAGPREDAAARALSHVKDAQDDADGAKGACRRALEDLEDLADQLSSLKREATEKGLRRAQRQAEELRDAARQDCSGGISKRAC